MEFVLIAKFKIIVRNAVVLVITLAMLWWNVKGRKYSAMVFVLVTKVVIASHYVKRILIVLVVKNVTMEGAELYVLP